MIRPLEGRRAFQRPQVGNVLNDADHRTVTALIGADSTRVGRIQVAAGAAGANRYRRICHRGGERLEQDVFALDQMQRGAAGRSRAEPRQLCQQLDQPLYF